MSNKYNSYKKYQIKLLEYLFVILFLSLTFFNLNNYFSKKEVLGVSTENEVNIKKIEYLDKLVQNNPSYLDGYLELVNLEISDSNYLKANEYLESAKSINPNSQELKIIEKGIEGI